MKTFEFNNVYDAYDHTACSSPSDDGGHSGDVLVICSSLSSTTDEPLASDGTGRMSSTGEDNLRTATSYSYKFKGFGYYDISCGDDIIRSSDEM